MVGQKGTYAGTGEHVAVRAQRIVEAEFTSPERCDTHSIATRLGVEVTRLCHCYRARYRTTIGREIRRRRIDLACRLLHEDPERLFKEVAASVGFRLHAYRSFLNAFRQETGMAPHQYRRRLVHERLEAEEAQKASRAARHRTARRVASGGKRGGS